MSHTREHMETLKEDLITLGIDAEKLESVTVQDARIAYHKTSREIHPDKADPENLDQVAKYTALFQEAGNSYQRILNFVIEKLQHDKENQSANDEAIFAKENFHRFNFPMENKGSFTVNVKDNLAEVWQECLHAVYGEPRIVRNANGRWCMPIMEITQKSHFISIITISQKTRNRVKFLSKEEFSPGCVIMFLENFLKSTRWSVQEKYINCHS